MLTIRFSRIGKRRKPFYRIIISEKSKDTQGKYLELLGHYNPHTKETVLKADRINHWVRMGAEMSNSVFNLLVNHKVIESDTKRKVVSISKKRAARMLEKGKSEVASDATKPKTDVPQESAKPEEITPTAPA